MKSIAKKYINSYFTTQYQYACEVDSKEEILNIVHEVMRRKHYSLRTGKSYVHWMKRFF